MTTTEIKTNDVTGVTTAPEVEWLDPYVVPPPVGSAVLLLTWGNVLIQGSWGSNGHDLYAAWAPKLSRAEWLKKRMYDKYIGTYTPPKVEN